MLCETCPSCLSRACATHPLLCTTLVFLFAKDLDVGLLSACWGGTEQDQMLGCCVSYLRQRWLSMRRSCFVLGVWWLRSFTVKNAHLIASREVLEQKRIKRTVELFCSSFHPQANQTLIVLSNPAVIVTLCFTKDYATMCSVCQMMTKAWSVIYARVICFFVFLISLMISPYINFNKFLRICWCTLILARGWGCIISAQKKKKRKAA